MGYREYGIDRALVQKARKKLKDRQVKEKVKTLAEGVTKEDLQNRERLADLLGEATRAMKLPLTKTEADAIIDFVVAQRIDPNNTLQLIRLWSMLHY